MHRKEEVYKLTEQFDVTRLHYVGTDMLTRLIDETVDNMDDSTFDLYMKYHFFVCEREDMVGVTNHMLDILEKN